MKDKKKVAKVIIERIFLALGLLILLLILYFVGSVNLWGKNRAEKALNKYAKEYLGIQEEINCKYSWYSNCYIVTNDLGITLEYRRHNNSIHDDSFSQQETVQLQRDYNKVIEDMPDNITVPEYIDVWTDFSPEDYNRKAQRLYLLGIYNTDKLSKEESMKMPASITMDIVEQLGDYYNFTGVQVIYYDKNGVYEIAFSNDSYEPFTEKELLKNTRKMKENEYSEEYRDWLAENDD